MVKQLQDELNLIVDVDPDQHRSGATDTVVQKLFFDFLDRHQDELIPRFGVDTLGIEEVPERFDQQRFAELSSLDSRLEGFHPDKMSYRLARRLASAGLLVEHGYWRKRADGTVLLVSDMAMHRELVGLYLAVLADAIARENAMTPVTDQPIMHAAASGWTVESMAQVLLSDDRDDAAEEQGELAQAFAVMALQTVLPRDLASVPVSRIIEVRRRLFPEMLTYREYLQSLTDFFVELAEVPDPQIRTAKLRLKVESEITGPIEKMERELGRLGLQPVRAVLSLQTLAPPAALAMLTNAVGLPSSVTATGVAAGCIVGASKVALERRQEIRRESPVGYLLGLSQELGPSDTVARFRTAFRRASPRRHHHRLGPR